MLTADRAESGPALRTITTASTRKLQSGHRGRRVSFGPKCEARVTKNEGVLTIHATVTNTVGYWFPWVFVFVAFVALFATTVFIDPENWKGPWWLSWLLPIGGVLFVANAFRQIRRTSRDARSFLEGLLAATEARRRGAARFLPAPGLAGRARLAFAWGEGHEPPCAPRRPAVTQGIRAARIPHAHPLLHRVALLARSARRIRRPVARGEQAEQHQDKRKSGGCSHRRKSFPCSGVGPLPAGRRECTPRAGFPKSGPAQSGDTNPGAPPIYPALPGLATLARPKSRGVSCPQFLRSGGTPEI